MSKSSKSQSIFSLEDQFAFYGQYHSNKTNIAIHICCVPLIFWSALSMANAIPGSLEIPLTKSSPDFLRLIFENSIKVNFSMLVGLAYTLYFIALEPIAGLLYSPILLTLTVSAAKFYNSDPNTHFNIALGLHVFSWIMQFIGHGKFEGRKPALLDSLFQSVVLAVFFVWCEVLFGLGYKPELHKRLQNKIGKAVYEYRRENAQKAKSS